jgi:hypothetical protein
VVIRVGVHLTINGELSDELGWTELDHPETANRDVAGTLRAVADVIESDSRFYDVVINAVCPPEALGE